ncbi:MAG: YceI family protein [Archangium sp.]|nr:YceI family protein [Archangium sp.]
MDTATQPASAAIPAPLASPVTRWELDTVHSEVGFRVRHMMVSWTRGKFDRFAGTLELDGQDVTKSKIEVAIEAGSINTNAADRDAHLKSPDFFDAANFSHLKFTSQKVEQVSGGGLRVLGQLEIRGVKKAVALDVEPLTPAAKDPWGGTRRGTRATTKLSRKDFGLNWNAALELGGVLVGDEVEITLEIELIQK